MAEETDDWFERANGDGDDEPDAPAADAGDDWFERALREDDADSEADDSAAEVSGDEASEEAGSEGDDPGMEESADSDPEDGDPADAGEDSADLSFGDLDGTGPGDDPSGAWDPGAGEDVTAIEDGRPAEPGVETAEDESAFGTEFDDSVGDDSDDDDGGGSLFDDDFAAAMENVPDMPGGAGGGGAGGGIDGHSDVDFGLAGPEEADLDGDLDTDLPRIELGIEGLDRMIQGGVPERTLMVAIGSAGTGKTTFGLQFINHGLAQGERAVYITLEESHERVVNSATEKGFPFDEYVEEGRLAIVDIDPVEMANSLASIQSELPRLVEQFGAARLVLDSVSLLEMMYDDRATRRNEIYDFTKSLKDAGVTALMTSEASSETPYASRHGIVEYLTDAVFILQYVRPDDFRETRLAIEIQKIRDANHSREKKPYEITDEGISVYQQANLF